MDQILADETDQQQQQFSSEADIQMDAPSMDIGEVSLTDEDQVLSQVFASGAEINMALQANNLQGIPNPNFLPEGSQAMTRTASRKVGTQPSSGVSQLGGSSSSSQDTSDINSLTSLWNTAPDVSSVFNS